LHRALDIDAAGRRSGCRSCWRSLREAVGGSQRHPRGIRAGGDPGSDRRRTRPREPGQRAKARLRLKHDALIEALTGRFDDHHAFLCRIILRRIDELSAVIEEVTGRIETELAPFHDAVDRLVTIPGVDRSAAAVILAETGGDMGGAVSLT
jgi:hypothetical protein